MDYDTRNLQHSETTNQAMDLLLEYLCSRTPVTSQAPALIPQEEQLLDAFFTEALARIVSMPQHEYEELLANIVVAYAESECDEMVFNIRDKNRLSLIRFIVLMDSKIKQSGRTLSLMKMSAETVDAEGGFLLVGKDVRIDCTLETLLAQAKAQIAPDLLALLRH